LDPFFVGAATERPIRWMSKVENFKTPIVRTLFKNLGAFELDRDNSAAGWAQAKEYLKNGKYVGIFPEGTRAVENELGEFRTGAVRLAIEMGVPIVPMAVIGSKDSLPKGKLVMKPVRVKCRVGNPIYYDEYYGKGEVPYKEIRKLTNELRQIVTDLRDEKDKEEKELSIGYPKDREDKPSSMNPMKLLKRVGIEIVKVFDNAWYSLLLNLDLIGAGDVFRKACYGTTGAILDVWTELMNPLKVIDFEKYIPEKGAAVLSVGHNSEWDVLMIAYAVWLKVNRRHLYEMAKESLFKIPIVNAWARTHWAFPLRRGAHDVNSIEQAKAYLERGELVVVYPEGTTNTGGGELLEGHTGAVRLAIETKVPIIPIGVTGSEDIYPKHAKMINFGKSCIFKAGEPFMEHAQYFDKPMPDYNELKRITANMMVRIKDLMLYNNPDV
jgi:1-acyl-sn-glycerol-3-phosphate acyltransferase